MKNSAQKHPSLLLAITSPPEDGCFLTGVQEESEGLFCRKFFNYPLIPSLRRRGDFRKLLLETHRTLTFL